eukprot:jgi/Bigna1/50918/estExt_Genewise1.C_1000013
MRTPFMKLQAVSRATGSAYIEMEGVKVICGVYGPTSNPRASYSDKGSLSCSVEFAPFAKTNRRTREDEQEERAISLVLEEALTVSIQLDKFPKAVIKAWVVILEAGKGHIAAAISCVSLALADAGIELYDLVTAASVGRLSSKIVVDPGEKEYQRSDYEGSLWIAYMPSLGQITYISQSGRIDLDASQKMLELCTEGCIALHSAMRSCLVESAKKLDRAC